MGFSPEPRTTATPHALDHIDGFATAERRLARAETVRHIAEAERRIACQHDVIACLVAHGHDTTVAEDLLLLMSQALDALRAQQR